MPHRVASSINLPEAATSSGAIVTGGSLMYQMVIFNDPLYLYIAIAGSIVSFFGMFYEVVQGEIEKKFWIIAGALIKAALLAFIVTPMWFMALMHAGGSIVEHFVGITGFQGIFNSFWLLASLMLAWFTIPVVNTFVEKIKRKKD